MESQLRQQGDQRHRAEADLTAVRDLCVKLDHQKDTLMQQLDDKDALKTQVNMHKTVYHNVEIFVKTNWKIVIT